MPILNVNYIFVFVSAYYSPRLRYNNSIENCISCNVEYSLDASNLLEPVVEDSEAKFTKKKGK